jgi:hypothetical protein
LRAKTRIVMARQIAIAISRLAGENPLRAGSGGAYTPHVPSKIPKFIP